MVGIYVTKTFGRKKLLLWGHLGIFLSHLLVGIFIITDVNYGVIIMICFFLFAY